MVARVRVVEFEDDGGMVALVNPRRRPNDGEDNLNKDEGQRSDNGEGNHDESKRPLKVVHQGARDKECSHLEQCTRASVKGIDSSVESGRHNPLDESSASDVITTHSGHVDGASNQQHAHMRRPSQESHGRGLHHCAEDDEGVHSLEHFAANEMSDQGAQD